MRGLLLLSLTLLATTNYAQDFAEDWTRTDCDGLEHHLFAELDAGNCVIMEFAMATGCVPCITAAENIGPLVDEYNALYDNRVKYYTFDYDDGLTCEDMLAWADEYALNPTAVFNNGTDILAYYGSMGMPTIVIVGGADHGVDYEKMGFTVSQMENIEASILQALGIEETTVPNTYETPFTVFPNPSTQTVSVSGNAVISGNVTVTDIHGTMIEHTGNFTFSNTGTATYSLNVGNFSNGIYFIQVNEHGKTYTEKFIVNH